jgi:hypothetical protein
MAKRKEGGDEAALVLTGLALLAVIALTVVIYLPPIILIGAVFYLGYRARKTPANFFLDAGEAARVLEIEFQLSNIFWRLDEIEAEGAHLKKNAGDGMYNRGSKLGMQLNSELENLVPLSSSLYAERIRILRRPAEDLEKWLQAATKRDAARAAGIVYIVVWLTVSVIELRSTSNLSHFIARHVLFSFSSVSDAIYGSATLAALLAGIAFPIASLVCRAHLEASSREAIERVDSLASREFESSGKADESDLDDEDQAGASDGDGDDTYWSFQKRHERSADTEPWYKVLGVSPDASRHEINAAWREKIKMNHPDNVAAMDEAFRVLADRRAKAINLARSIGLGEAGPSAPEL